MVTINFVHKNIQALTKVFACVLCGDSRGTILGCNLNYRIKCKISIYLISYDILGGTPYPTINNRELLRLLKSGYRMEKPENCADPM